MIKAKSDSLPDNFHLESRMLGNFYLSVQCQVLSSEQSPEPIINLTTKLSQSPSVQSAISALENIHDELNQSGDCHYNHIYNDDNDNNSGNKYGHGRGGRNKNKSSNSNSNNGAGLEKHKSLTSAEEDTKTSMESSTRKTNRNNKQNNNQNNNQNKN